MKNIILAALVLFSCNIVSAKKVIVNPSFSARSSENIRITRIETDDSGTTLYLNVTQPEGSDVLVSSKTYIQPSNGGKKLYVTGSEGITLDESMIVPHSRQLRFELHFPKLDDQVGQINYRAGENGSYWHIFEIETNPNFNLVRKLPEPGIGYREMNGKKWKYIQNPRYAAKKGNGLEIVEIELMDTATVIYFEYHGAPNNWIRIPSQSCIQPADGGKLLYAKGAVGMPFDEKVYLGENGFMAYKLYFPPVDKKTTLIHFKEANPGGSWFIFDIEI